MYEYVVSNMHAQQMLHYSLYMKYNQPWIKWPDCYHMYNSLNINYYTH